MPIVKTSTPLPPVAGDRIVLVAIEGLNDPDSAGVVELSTEERVRLAWKHFREAEIEEARRRKSDARKLKGGLSPTSKRGKSIIAIAKKVGMKETSYRKAQQVVEFADRLKAQGSQGLAKELLTLLNEVSISAASQRLAQLIQEFSDEQEIQAETAKRIE